MNLPDPPEGWPTERDHRPAQYDRSQPPVFIYQQAPARHGPPVAGWIAAGLGGGALLLTTAVVAVAVAVAAAAVALVAVVVWAIYKDIRKGK